VTLAGDALLPILAAAERAGVDIAQIHRWEDVGGIEIQRRGLKEFVLLDRVMALSASARRNDPNSRRGALRARLADAAAGSTSVAELQQVARDRSDGQAL
jgi:hypothetical protein